MGKNLEDIRHKMGMSLDDVAQKAGVSAVWLSKVEKGKASLSYAYLGALAYAYNMEVPNVWHAHQEAVPDEEKKELDYQRKITAAHVAERLRAENAPIPAFLRKDN